jgi:hypothetical protein
MSGKRWQPRGRALAVGLCVVVFAAGCQSKVKEASEGEDGVEVVREKKQKVEPQAEPSEGLAFLMTMTWEEAKGLSAQSLEVPPFFRVAADEIQVLKSSPDGTPRRVRAKGKVFIEMEFAESGRVLCQEAYLADDELILRGKPLLQRGGSAVEGMDDITVFYMLGTRLRVIGRHRVMNESALVQEAMKVDAAALKGKEEGTGMPGAPPILPIMAGPWVGSGPNPLLPPLSSESVPEEIRLKMRAEAEAIDVMPLDLPGDGQNLPPAGNAAANGEKKKEPQPMKEEAPLLPVPAKPGGGGN